MENQAQIGVVIIIGCLVMLTLALTIFLFYTNNKKNILQNEKKLEAIEKENQLILFKTVTGAEENQKERFSNDLHDTIIPLLSFVGRNIDLQLEDLKRRGVEPIHLNNSRALIDQSITGIKEISQELIPKVLINHGLFRAIERLLRLYSANGISSAELENKTSSEGSLPFSKGDEVQIYRMFQELLNNLNKHAKYTFLQVEIESTATELQFEFMHDGLGVTNTEIMKLTETGTGMGLKSLKGRAMLLKAIIDYSIERDCAKIHLKIPYTR